MLEYTEDFLEDLRETEELECKLAAGPDGRGKLPKDFWPTYSAFANTQGGVVVLGITQDKSGFRINGILEPDKVIEELFNTACNPEKVSENLLTADSVEIRDVRGKNVILIRIPPATRTQKPVFINGNPLKGNTYRRYFSGDHRCDDATVQRMLAEKQEECRDRRILPGFGRDDIDWTSFRAYRQMLRDARHGHTWLELSDWDLLGKLQGWRKERESGDDGLTVAGLAMFGLWESIQEGLPAYWVDYQERPEAKTENRWVDRIYPDGTWPANLFTFYRRVYPRLVADLKVPFRIQDGQRKDFTPVHEAVREALVNCIVHADLEGRGSILVVKRPDLLGFRNPGGMRVPLQQAIEGGFSDCRNGIMHQMFLMVGLVERAGSGVPRIYSGWASERWRPPIMYEKFELEQTLLELRMLDLFPEGEIDVLRRRFPGVFDELRELEKLILATASIESVVTHSRVSMMTKDHPHDITLALSRLARDGFLESDGKGKGTVYHLPGTQLPSPDDVFGAPMASGGPSVTSSDANVVTKSDSLEVSNVLVSKSLRSSDTSFDPNVTSSRSEQRSASDKCEYRDEHGRLVSPHLEFPVIDDPSKLSPAFRQQLEWIARLPRSSRKLPQAEMDVVIKSLCEGNYVTRSALSKLVHRSPEALGRRFLSRLVRDRILTPAFPKTPTHERQAYIAAPE